MNVKRLNSEDKPRERLLNNGARSLSNSELLSIIIGSGSTSYNVLQTSQMILDHFDHSLDKIAKSGVSELKKIKGIGNAKAISILASLELSKRYSPQQDITQITEPEIAYNILKPKLQHLNHEEFWAIFLTRSNKVIKTYCLSKGGLSATVVDPKIIFKKALELSASAVILAHNHPSGALEPSIQDINITEKIKKGGQILDIQVLDHLIITDHHFYSFSEDGKI